MQVRTIASRPNETPLAFPSPSREGLGEGDEKIRRDEGVKIAVSLPKEQFEQIESLCRQLKLSRSALASQAIYQFLKACQEEEDIRRYIEGYRKHPETEKELAEAAALAQLVLVAEEWEG